jgi:hypothetical protein
MGQGDVLIFQNRHHEVIEELFSMPSSVWEKVVPVLEKG